MQGTASRSFRAALTWSGVASRILTLAKKTRKTYDAILFEIEGPMRQAILYVDDEAVILLALKQELLRQFRGRYLVETALDADEAERLLDDLEAEGTQVVLVISDWLMPGRKGDEFLIDLHRKRPDIRAILVTGQADEEAIRRTEREADLCACFRKPWDMGALLRAIETCIAGPGSDSGPQPPLTR